MPKIEDLRVALEAADATTAKALLAADPSLADSLEKTPPPLHLMVFVNRLDMIGLLLDHGADIELRDQDRDTTPLRYAIMYARKDAIRLLVQRGANTGTKGPGTSTALELAEKAADGQFEEFDDLPRSAEYREVVDLLKELGC